ncbi:MAG: glycosyltransferase 87 family protein [Candidatus Limnocylindrales bacterium]
MSGRSAGIVGLVAVLGWAGLIWLGVTLYGTTPRTAAFDLELLLGAGRAVAAGHSPYDPAIVAGAAPVAERLFYSYPPVVAQLMAIVASIPAAVMFVGWTAAAVGGLGLLARSLANRFGSSVSPNVAALTTVALAPLVFPFAIGLLFGNLDVFFPVAFGVLLLGVVPPASPAAVAGTSTSLAAIAKLHPASLGLWLVARAGPSREARRVLFAAVVAGLAVVGVSLLVGGPQPWIDYAAVVRAGSGADLVDPRNAGPAAQIALLLGGGGSGAESLARTIQIPVTLAALALTVVAAVRVADPVESLAWAVALSLVVLPVTWYHYPAALIPFALVAVLRSTSDRATDRATARRVRWTVLASASVASIAIGWLPLLYLAVGLVLAAVRMSRPAPAPVPAMTTLPAGAP